MLHLQLETEVALFNSLARQTRNDAIRDIVLQRVAREIQSLQDKINAQPARKESAQRAHTNRLVQYVRETMRRLGDYKNRRNRAVFGVFESQEQQTAPVTQ